MTIKELLEFIGDKGIVGMMTIFFAGGVLLFFSIAREFFKTKEIDRKMYESDLQERIETRAVQKDLSEAIKENTKQYKVISVVLAQSQEQRNRIETTGSEIKRIVEELKSSNELSDEEIKKYLLLLVREIKEIKDEFYFVDWREIEEEEEEIDD